MRPAPPLATLRAPSILLLALVACAGAPVAPAPPRALAGQPPVEEEKPVWATTGWTRPAEARAGCVAGAVVAPAELKGQVEVTAKFAVAQDGAVDRLEDVTPVAATPAVLNAVSKAVRGCRFTPGRDPEGHPAYVWVLLPVKVGKIAPRPRATAAAASASEPKDLKVAPVEVSKDQAPDAAPPAPASSRKKPARKP